MRTTTHAASFLSPIQGLILIRQAAHGLRHGLYFLPLRGWHSTRRLRHEPCRAEAGRVAPD